MVFSGSGASKAYSQDELNVQTQAKAQLIEVSMQDSYERQRIVYGQIESAKQSALGFELSGVLSKVFFDEGMNITKGDLLAELDLERLQAREGELNAALQRAQADAKLASLSLERVQHLVEAKLEPQQRLDESRAALDAAQALVVEVEARLDSLAVEKAKSTLRAPFDGQIVSQMLDEGTVVNVGQAVFEVLANNTLEARFGLPENIAFGVEKGQRYLIKLGQSSFDARVKTIAKQRNLSTRTIDAIFEIAQNDLSPQQLNSLVSGDLVNISVSLDVPKRGAWLPFSALTSGVRGLWTVLVYEPQSKTLSSRLVSIEHMEGKRAFVTGAIEDNELLIANGAHRFVPGQTLADVETISLQMAIASTGGGQ